MATLPRTEFAQALKAIASERGLDADVILDTIKHAIIAAYRRDAKERGEDVDSFEYDVEIDPSSGEARVFAWPEGEEDKREDVTPPGFGRIAAQTAKQVIHQKIREAEKGAIMDEFSDRIGTLISGMVLRFDGPDVRVDLGRAEGVMPASERVPNERLSANQRYTFLLKDIEETPRGKNIVLSRTDPEFVVKLFEREVPEMSSGSVEVKAIAREAGVRTKIAVDSSQSGVDPVGSCVGQKGVRVQAVTNELGGERVDIIPWSETTEELIKAALSPAEGLTVTLKEEEDEDGDAMDIAVVQAPEDQLSLAIGKDGQNARLAAKLTGYKIEIEGIEGEETEEQEKEDQEEAEEKEQKAEKKEEKEKQTEEVEQEEGEDTEEEELEEKEEEEDNDEDEEKEEDKESEEETEEEPSDDEDEA